MMEEGKPFSLTFVTYDRKRSYRSGRVVSYEQAELMRRDQNVADGAQPPTQGQRPPTAREAQSLNRANRRRANHYEHYTRNIRILQDGEPTSMIVKLHPPLVLIFNNEIVL